MGLKVNSSSPLNDDFDVDFTQLVKDFLGLLESYPNIDKTPKFLNIGFTCLPQASIPAEIR